MRNLVFTMLLALLTMVVTVEPRAEVITADQDYHISQMDLSQDSTTLVVVSPPDIAPDTGSLLASYNSPPTIINETTITTQYSIRDLEFSHIRHIDPGDLQLHSTSFVKRPSNDSLHSQEFDPSVDPDPFASR